MKGNWWWMFITKCFAPTPELSFCTRYLYFWISPPLLMEALGNSKSLYFFLNPAHPCLDPFAKHLHSQLHPLWQSSGKFGRHLLPPAIIIIHLNPPLKTYGEGSSLSFSCQHGPVECEVGIQTTLGTWVCSQQDVCLFALNWVNWCKFCVCWFWWICWIWWIW